MEIKELLPIGTIVRLQEGQKRLMIYGVKQSGEDDTRADYIGVLYPEGNMGPEYQYLFNHEAVEEIYFRGFEDEERDQFLDMLEGIYREGL